MVCSRPARFTPASKAGGHGGSVPARRKGPTRERTHAGAKPSGSHRRCALVAAGTTSPYALLERFGCHLFPQGTRDFPRALTDRLSTGRLPPSIADCPRGHVIGCCRPFPSTPAVLGDDLPDILRVQRHLAAPASSLCAILGSRRAAIPVREHIGRHEATNID
jgi:hypothetical protein